MPTPPAYKKVNPADQPILYMALSSPTLPLYTVDEYAETMLAQRISTISGVAQVQVFGSQKYAVRVQLDPSKLATLGIGIDEVQKAVAQSNVNLPTGTLYGTHQAFTVQATGQLTDCGGLPPAHRGLPERLARAARAARPGDRRRADRQGGELVQRRARGRPRHPASAGDEHDRGGGLDQEGPARLPGAAPGRRQPEHPLRPLGVHPRLGQRRAVHPAPRHLPSSSW